MAKMVNALLAGLAVALLVAAPASANVLGNPGFESPTTDPNVEYYGAGDVWTSFGGGIFTVNSLVSPPFEGNQSLKLFGGCCSGAFQQFPANPGEIWNGGVWMLNSFADPMSGGQVGAVNIEWIQADGNTQSAIVPFISNGTFTADSAPLGEWQLQTITGEAPADAAYARIVVITGDFQPGGPGGAPFMDAAFFENLGPVATESSSWGQIKALYE